MKPWAKTHMGDLFSISKGQIGIRAATPGTFPLVTTSESHQSHIEAHFSGDAVCIPMVSATGHGHASLKRLHHIQGEFAVGSILCACVNRKPDRVSARYVFHYLTACKDSVLIPLMQGSANVSLKLADIEGIVIPLPPLAEQHALVARIEALAGKTRKINEHLDATEADVDALLRAYIFHPPGEQVVKRKMSELVTLRRPDVAVSHLDQYQFAGVYSFGRGVFRSVSKAGSDFAYARLSTVRAGDFTYPKLMAWEGALGVVPPECDGMVVSPEFPVFTVDTDTILPEVLDIYFRTPEVWPALAEVSGGTNMRRRRLQPSAFLNYEMPVPSMRIQRKLSELHRRARSLKARHAAIREANRALLPSTLERLFAIGG